MSCKNVKVNDYETSVGNYFNDIGGTKPLSKKEETALWKRFREKNDMKARDELIKANLKFVASVAKGFRGCGVPFADIISEGNIGLINAIDRFDYRKNTKVISYAVWWIRKSILSSLEKKGVLDADDIDGNKLAEKSIYRKEMSSVPKDEEDIPLSRTETVPLSSGNSFVVPETVERDNRNYLIEELMEGLPERDRIVISDYYGLNNTSERTLEEIGEDLGLTRERVRQINEKALKKLRTRALEKNLRL